jgi:hypothetical protein
MARKSKDLSLVEMPGSQFENLRAAQRNATHGLANSLAGTLRALLADGWLISIDGRIIPNPERRL